MVVNRIVDAVCDTSEVSAGLGGKAGNDAIWEVDAMIPGEDNAWILIRGWESFLERSFWRGRKSMRQVPELNAF